MSKPLTKILYIAQFQAAQQSRVGNNAQSSPAFALPQYPSPSPNSQVPQPPPRPVSVEAAPPSTGSPTIVQNGVPPPTPSPLSPNTNHQLAASLGKGGGYNSTPTQRPSNSMSSQMAAITAALSRVSQFLFNAPPCRQNVYL